MPCERTVVGEITNGAWKYRRRRRSPLILLTVDFHSRLSESNRDATAWRGAGVGGEATPSDDAATRPPTAHRSSRPSSYRYYVPPVITLIAHSERRDVVIACHRIYRPARAPISSIRPTDSHRSTVHSVHTRPFLPPRHASLSLRALDATVIRESLVKSFPPSLRGRSERRRGYQMVCALAVTMQRFHLDNKENEIAVVHTHGCAGRPGRRRVENNQAECGGGWDGSEFRARRTASLKYVIHTVGRRDGGADRIRLIRSNARGDRESGGGSRPPRLVFLVFPP